VAALIIGLVHSADADAASTSSASHIRAVLSGAGPGLPASTSSTGA